MSKNKALSQALFKAKNSPEEIKPYAFDIKPPELFKGVLPKDAIAMDAAIDYQYLNNAYCGMGFPGYAYLAQLATRAEFMRLTLSLSNELTRGGVEFTSKQDDDNNNSAKIKAIEAEWKRLNVMSVMSQTAINESYFGRGQIYIDIDGAKPEKPLILSKNTIKIGSLNRIGSIEPIWTTPSMYNANDPTAANFYQPTEWYSMGKKIHASRLLTVITRPLPDILKPAFNFSGMSLSQMAEPYVDNWLRTRQSVSDLINQFSTTVLATSMGDILESAESDDPDSGNNLLARADLFTAMRSNKGLMLLDKEREELMQINTPLSGLDALQAQAQEQMCSVSRIPAIVFTGISPGGLNANSEGELKVFYDWIKSQQDAYWREPLGVILKLIQLSLFGEIDDDIGLNFLPLQQMTPSEKADIRFKDMQTDTGYINAGVLAGQETRVKLAQDPDSGYDSIDATMEIVPPNPDPYGGIDTFAKDSDFKESEHPRDKDGKFESGSGGAISPEKRNKIAKSEALYQKYGEKSEGGRGKFKEAARSGEFDHLADEFDEIQSELDKAQQIKEADAKSAKAEKSKLWRDKHLPKLSDIKKAKEDADALEKRRRVESAIEYEKSLKFPKQYLKVPYSDKDLAKSAGGRWDPDSKLWYYQGESLPDSLHRYINTANSGSKVESSNVGLSNTLPKTGNVSADDPSMYGEWLLGYEGEPWSRVRLFAPENSGFAKDEWLSDEQQHYLNTFYAKNS